MDIANRLRDAFTQQPDVATHVHSSGLEAREYGFVDPEAIVVQEPAAIRVTVLNSKGMFISGRPCAIALLKKSISTRT